MVKTRGVTYTEPMGKGKGIVRGCLIVVAVLVLTTAAAVAGASAPPRTEKAGTLRGGSLLDADHHGAVIGLRRSIVGVDASGRVVWRDREAARAGSRAVCVARCPDAILSGSLESLNDPTVADPPLRIHLGGELRVVEHSELKHRVIWARSLSDTVAVTGDAERVRFEFASPAATTRSGPIEDVGTSMFTNPRQTRGWTYSLTGDSATLRWLERRQGSWRLRGKPLEGADVCASFNLKRALILRRQALLVPFGAGSGKKVDVDLRVPRALPTGCEVSGGGFLLSQVVPGARSVRGTISFVANDGDLRWQRSYARQAFGLALAAPGLAATLAGSRLAVVAANGRVLASRKVGDVFRIGPREFAVLTPEGALASVRMPMLQLLPLSE